MSDYPRKKRLRILSTALNLERIPLIGFGTYAVNTPQVIYNALSVGYRHLDLAESYNNLQHVKQALSLALAPLTEGGLGIERKDIWITMKIPVQSINNIGVLLEQITSTYSCIITHFQCLIQKRSSSNRGYTCSCNPLTSYIPGLPLWVD